jgi:hypothetical protein
MPRDQIAPIEDHTIDAARDEIELAHAAALLQLLHHLECQRTNPKTTARNHALLASEILALRFVLTELFGVELPAPRKTPEVYARTIRGAAGVGAGR